MTDKLQKQKIKNYNQYTLLFSILRFPPYSHIEEDLLLAEFSEGTPQIGAELTPAQAILLPVVCPRIHG
jgi:hypothetical protein